MRIPEICKELKEKLENPYPGRNFLTVLGNYGELEKFRTEFSKVFQIYYVSLNKDFLNHLQQNQLLANLIEFENRGKVNSISNQIRKALKDFITNLLSKKNVLGLYGLELIFGYDIKLDFLTEWVTDEKKIVFLIPGEIQGGDVYIFPRDLSFKRLFPKNLVKNDWIWEINK